MKRRIKGLITLFFTLTAIMLTALALSSGASAAGDLDYKITYDENGEATIRVYPRVERNYITFTVDGTKPTYTSELFPEKITTEGKAISFRLAEYNIDNEYLWGIKLTIKPKVTKVIINEEFHSASTNVSLSCNTEGAKIYYTLDGSTPTTDSKRYFDGFIQVTESTYIKAIAVKSGYNKSNIVSKKILVKNYIGSPARNEKDTDDDAIVAGTKIKCSAAYHSESAATYVTLAPQKSSNKIYYTTDGSAPSKNSKRYTTKLKFTSLKTLRAVEYTPSGKVAATLKYSVKLRCKSVEMYCVDIAAGTNIIKMTCPTPGTDIYFTIDGKTPTTKSMKYTEPFMIGHTTRLKAIAVKKGYVNSAVKSVIGVDIPIDLTGFDYKDPKLVAVVDRINVNREWYGKKSLELDEYIARAAQKRAIELKVRMADERPNDLGWLSAVAEDGVYPTNGYEIIAEDESLDSIIKRVLDNPVADKYKYNKIGVGYNEYDGHIYWAILVVELA